jgi:hypothetical protein
MEYEPHGRMAGISATFSGQVNRWRSRLCFTSGV